MLGDLYYGALRSLGITALARHRSQGALVLCYHNVVPPPAGNGTPSFGDPGLHLPLDRFTPQVHWLKDHYRVIPLRELVARLESGRSVRRLAALTFDDAYTGAVTLAWPLLRKLGIPATMFIVAEAPGRGTPFWWDQPAIVRTDAPSTRTHRLFNLGGDQELIMSSEGGGAPEAASLPATHLPAGWEVLRSQALSGLDLGAHTLTHRTLTPLSDRDLQREIEHSREVIAERIDMRPDSLSYPYGIWDARVLEATRRAGYRAAVTLEFGLNKPGIDPRALRRVNVPASISRVAFTSWAAGMGPPRASAA